MKTQRKLGIWQRFVTWQERLNRRVDVDGLSDRTLRDVGLPRDDTFLIKVFI